MNRRRTLFSVVLSIGMICGGFLQSGEAEASGFQPAYVVADVPVDSQGESGVAARAAARAEGQSRAFAILLKRITPASAQQRLPGISPSRITDYVLDMEVKDEHVSARRYIGTYTFRFSPKGVMRLLRDAGITLMDAPDKPAVVIPLLQANGTTVLWDDANPWRKAWDEADAHAGLIPWIVPEGDLQDIQALDTTTAANNPSQDKVAPFSQRYSGAEPVIASAVETDRPESANLQIAVTRYAPDGPQTASVSVDTPKSGKKLYVLGVQAALSALEDLWKQQEQKTTPATPVPSVPVAGINDANSQTLVVTAPISGPHDWALLRTRLTQVPGVQSARLVVLTRNEIKIALRLTGSADSLQPAFAQQNLLLSLSDQGTTLTLQNGAAVPQ